MPTKVTFKLSRGEWLHSAAAQLTLADVPSARLDALILLGDATHLEKSHLLAHLEELLLATELASLNKQLARRAKHEPLAYIRGKSEFYGRKFLVDSRVLVPRPESETAITLLKELPLRNPARLADIGSGSGVLGLTAALELPAIQQTDLYDIDSGALQVARQNAKLYSQSANFYTGDLLASDYGPHDIILANLPYVPDGHTINSAAMMEPSLALFGGEDGLDLYRRLFSQFAEKTWRPQFVLTEALKFQHNQLTDIARKSNFELFKRDDLIQVWQPIGLEQLPE